MYTFDYLKNQLSRSNLYYLISMGLEGRYTYTNDHYTQSFGPQGRSLLGQPFDMLLHPEDSSIARSTRMQCMQYPEQLFPLLVRKHDRHGAFILTQWECQALTDDAGRILGVFCLGSNLAACLDEAGVPLLGSNLPHVTLASHEARRPLANLMGLVTVLRQTEDARQLRSLCTMILASAQQLDDVLQVLYKAPAAEDHL
ncbi:MAG TPA: PAS domain-containing protein [Chitinophaga sp.]